MPQILKVKGVACVDSAGHAVLDLDFARASSADDVRQPPSGEHLKAMMVKSSAVVHKSKQDLTPSQLSSQVATRCRALCLKTGCKAGQWTDEAQKRLAGYCAKLLVGCLVVAREPRRAPQHRMSDQLGCVHMRL